MKKYTYGDSIAVMILVGERLNLNPSHVEDAKRQLNGGAIHPITAASMEKESVRLNSSMALDENAVRKANLYVEVVMEEYGFDVLKRLYGASSNFYSGTSYGRPVPGASSMVREFAVTSVTKRSYVIEYGLKVNRSSMQLNTGNFIVDMFNTIEAAQSSLATRT
jgi:hypothetical protein